jgi:cytochrome c oxidase subunit 2
VEIHRYEKLWFGAALLLIVTFIGTIVFGAIGPGVAMIDDSGGTVSPDEVSIQEYPRIEQVGENEYEVYVLSAQFSFYPGSAEPIELPAGSEVTFYVTSNDVIHGFDIAGTNVNMMAIPGQISQATVEFEEPAEYGIVCNEYCGAGHHTMAGQLHVVPQSDYNGSDVQ